MRARPQRPKRSEGVFWALIVEASLPGVDLHEDFDVPVDIDERSVQKGGPYIEPPRQILGAVAQSAKAAVTRQDLAAAGIQMRQTEAGVEYHFGAARNPSFAIGLTAFVLIWTAALWLHIAIDAPLVFPLLTGLFE